VLLVGREQHRWNDVKALAQRKEVLEDHDASVPIGRNPHCAVCALPAEMARGSVRYARQCAALSTDVRAGVAGPGVAPGADCPFTQQHGTRLQTTHITCTCHMHMHMYVNGHAHCACTPYVARPVSAGFALVLRWFCAGFASRIMLYGTDRLHETSCPHGGESVRR
jgi:hypothetical protein